MFKLFKGSGDSNEKEIKRLQPIIDRINDLEPAFQKLTDGELRAKTAEFKAKLQDGAMLDELLPEAFAAIREAAKRTLGQRHFDVQLMGGIVLHYGKIAEMKTGEGKTMVATLPLYLNSLTGEGCHLVTVNDYLARRDPYWMGPIFHALGVSVASIYPMQKQDDHTPSLLFDPEYDSGVENDVWRHFKPVTRQEAYKADITYGTSSEFGFDYLRDNMAIDTTRCVQRQLNYAIVDEVDNLLIDEARTPLIISAPDMEAGQKYQIFARIIQRLVPEVDYEIKIKERIAELTDDGFAKMETLIAREGLLESGGLYDPENADLMRHMRNALNAREFYKRDQQYVVKDGNVIIVDEFTGRMMHGRRYSEGLHQAIEAKENVKIQQESRTFATITIQNYFRMYKKLAGMTGTAVTEAEEFHKIYELEVVVIPTNKPLVREDFGDQIYKDKESKFKAVVREIEEVHKQGRPVLIGTVSIEKSEYLSEMLKRKGIKHEILNAKQHEKEANIIARAGEPGAVTVATNMAGRGVDILLGGNPPNYKYEQDIDDYTHEQIIGFLTEPSATEQFAEDIIEAIEKSRSKILEAEKLVNKKIQEYDTEYTYYQEEMDRALKQRQESDNTEYEKQKQELEARIELKLKELKTAVNLLEQNTKNYNDIINKTPQQLKDKIKISPLNLLSERGRQLLELHKKIEDFDEWRQRHLKVIELGGLHVVGTERHEARRIDNQLRGRAGRQGDPGSSRFYVSLEDDVMRRFGGDRIKSLMNMVGMDENTPIENKLISRSIENAQVRVEGYHFDMRKHLVDYDNVINTQREIIYGERRKIIGGADLKANILSLVEKDIKNIVAANCSGYDIEQSVSSVINEAGAILPLSPDINAETLSKLSAEEIKNKLIDYSEELYSKREAEMGSDNMRILERLIMLRTIDTSWVEHLTAMDNMRQGIGMQAMAQRDPLVAYKRQSHEMFDDLMTSIQHDLVHAIFRMTIRKGAPPPKPVNIMAKATGEDTKSNKQSPPKLQGKTIGRNDPCPCGSGKKFKKCCGK